MLSPSVSTIGKYQLIRELKHQTNNKLYIVLVISTNTPLYLLKIYNTQSGYQTEKQVFSFQNLYQNFFIQACDSAEYHGANIQYIVSRYSNCQSLIQMGMLIRQFPWDAVRFYIYDIFSKLKFIHCQKKIPFRTLYASDIIFSEDKNLFLVGWSKQNQLVSEEQLIFDCSQIMYYMLTFGAFQQTGLGFKGTMKKRFLTEEFWDISKKKHSYLKFFPSDKLELSKLLIFLQSISVRNEESPITLQKIVSDPFFDSLPSFQAASQSLTKKQLQRISAHKQKDLKNFDIKIKRAKILNESFRSLSLEQDYETIRTPVTIGKKMPENIESLTFKLADFVQKFIATKLNENLNKYTVFGEEWVRLSHYQIQKNVQENSIQYFLNCQIKFVESEDVIPDSEPITFKITVQVEGQRKGENCIKNVEVVANKNLNQILLAKFEQFVTEGLIQSFKYSSE